MELKEFLKFYDIEINDHVAVDYDKECQGISNTYYYGRVAGICDNWTYGDLLLRTNDYVIKKLDISLVRRIVKLSVIKITDNPEYKDN